jgi:hyperosmotically inducible protein
MRVWKILRGSTALTALSASIILVLPPFGVTGELQKGGKELKSVHARLAERVRHELVMLPYYTLFDNLEFRIEGVDTVVLSGQVVKPTLKSDAGGAVQRLEGVGKLVNNIEVLPLSNNDDRLRLAAYRAVYSKTGLDRYALQAVPPIHIIVKNGNITLVGVVASQADKDLAGIAANGVSGAFSVTNNLRVEAKK